VPAPHAPPSEVAAASSIFNYAGPSRFSHSRNPSKGSPTAGGAGAAGATAQGLAAALAALPAGSGREVEMFEVGPAGTSGGGEWGPGEASGTSTPASEMGCGGPVRRPLLYDEALRSSDRQPALDSSSGDRGRRQQQRHAEGHSGQQMRSSFGLSPEEEDGAGGGANGSIAPAAIAAAGQGEPQGRQGAPFLDPSLSLSFGQSRSSPAADLGGRSLSLRHSQGSGGSDGEADTAASVARPPRGRAALLQAAEAATPTAAGITPSGGSAAALLSAGAGDSEDQEGGGEYLEAHQQQAGGSGSSDSAVTVRPRSRHAPTSSFDVAAELGYNQDPPAPEELFAAMVSKGGTPRAAPIEEDGEGVAAVHAGGGSSIGGGGLEGVGEGISSRWWTAYQCEWRDLPALWCAVAGC
jgi:hypothetical protein